MEKQCYGSALCLGCNLRAACENYYLTENAPAKDKKTLEYSDTVENSVDDYNSQYDVFETACRNEEGEPPAMTLGGVTIKDEAAPLMIEAVRRLAVVYKDQPMSFQALMTTVYDGLNQSDLARLRGVTRQTVCKALRRENARPLWEDVSRFMDSLDADALALWRLLCVERLSYRATAKRMRITPGRVAQLVRGLRERGLDLAGDLVMVDGKLVTRPSNIPKRINAPKPAKADTRPSPGKGSSPRRGKGQS